MSDYIDKMQLHVMGKQLVRDVAKLAADKQATNTAREYAKITAVNGDGTLELDKGTENYPMPISNVRRTVGAEAKVGDVVVVETTQHVPLATSIVSVDGDTDNRITGAIADAQDTADAAQTAADTAKAATDALQTLIRETSDGIEVGKSADGSTYTGTHTLVGTDAFEVHDKDHNTLASFGAWNIELAKSANVGEVGFFGGVDTIKGGIKYTSDGSYSSFELHAGKDTTEDEGWMYLASAASTGVTKSTKGWSSVYPVLTSTKKYLWGYSDSVITPQIIGVYTSGAASTGEILLKAHNGSANYASIDMGASKGASVTLQGVYGSQASLMVFPYSDSYGGIFFNTPRFYVNSVVGQPSVMFVGSKTATLTAVDSTHSAAVLFTASQYKAITGVAFDKTKHSVTCMNGEHDACANIWSMVASYSASEDNIHLMCLTSKKVSGAIRVNYTITIDAS